MSAHDIPTDVTTHVYFKPAGNRLQLLVRVPLKSMRDIDFPQSKEGYLDVEKLLPLLPNAAMLWIGDFMEVYEGERQLDKPKVAAMQISFESDRSFESFENAYQHTLGGKPSLADKLVWNQVHFDVLFEYGIQSDRSAFSIRPHLERLAERVVTVLRFQPPSQEGRVFEFTGDPGKFPLDPGYFQAFRRFVELGFLHILDGIDHLLFLFCLVIPFRRLSALIWVVTAFTVAHSITLIGSAYDLAPSGLWFPPLIEVLIAVSIIYMALENIVGGGTLHRRWVISFCFGLVHGFGFSFALRESLQFAGTHVLSSLLAFNLGVELGQLLVLVLLVPALNLFFRHVVAERIGAIILSALATHTGWHWMTERWQILRQYRWTWPEWNAAVLSGVALWLMWVLIGGGLLWFAAAFFRSRTGAASRNSEAS